MRVKDGAKFVSGDLSSGQLLLRRDDGTEEWCGVLIVSGLSLSDNGDSTFDVTFG